MSRNNNLSVLPFYTTIDEQLSRRTYAFGEVYPLFVQKTYIHPFQIQVPIPSGGSPVTVTSVSLIDYNTNTLVQDLTNAVTVTVKEYDGYDVLVHRYGAVTGAAWNVGRYYLKIQTNYDAYYSEVFTVVDDISPYLRIEWWDEQDLVMRDSRIVYEVTSAQKYHSVVFLDTQLGMPDYDFEEEGETRDGLFFPEKMLSEKTYKMTFLASEYMCDVMRFVRMSDRVKVTDKYGRTYQCDTFLITPKWETQGDLASVEVEFQTNVVAKRIGRAI